jgi:hypothetical protein
MSRGSLTRRSIRLDKTVDLLPCSCSLILSELGKASDPETSFQVPPDYAGNTTERLVAQQPTSARFRAGDSLRDVIRRFLSYTSASRLPDPIHLAVLDRPGFVAAAPALSSISWVRLPPATLAPLRRGSRCRSFTCIRSRSAFHGARSCQVQRDRLCLRGWLRLHDGLVDPGPSTRPAAATEYGHPGMVWQTPSQRQYRWQCRRSADVSASGRGHGVTSIAMRTCRSAPRGNSSPLNAIRNRAMSIRPAARPSYNAPCPRRCTPAKDNSGRDATGPPVHNTASSESQGRCASRAVIVSLTAHLTRRRPVALRT